MSAEYFLYPVIWEGRTYHLIWCTDDEDGVLLDEHQKIVHFLTEGSARAYSSQRDIEVPQVASRPLDLSWIVEKLSTPIDCAEALDAWNLFADVASSVDGSDRLEFIALDNKLRATYDKLFWGNNLPTVTPPGEHYNPEWSVQEMIEIGLLLTTGLRLFLDNLAPSRA